MNVLIYIIMALVVIAVVATIVRRRKPRGIAKEAKRLQEFFLLKEESERYLAGLEELGQVASTSQQSYNSTRKSYQERIAQAIKEIARIKSTLHKELEDKQRDCEAYEVERERLAARFKTGELPLQKYEPLERKLRKKTRQTEPDMMAIERLISAESSGEVQSYRGTAVQKIPARQAKEAASALKRAARVKKGKP